MRKLFITISLLLLAVAASPQAPHLFKYQAVLRDVSGDPQVNKNVSIRISIVSGTIDGPLVFSETQNVTTNAFGLVNIEVGSTGESDLMDIEWHAGPYFIKISVNGTDLSASQLLSVPYALHSNMADSVTSVVETDPLFLSHPAYSITQEQISEWDSTHVLLPGMSMTQILSIENPEPGLIVIDTTAGAFDILVYDGLVWQKIIKNSSAGTYIEGDLEVTGSIIGSINIDTVHVSQITGLLGDGYSLRFPDILDNLGTLDVSGTGSNPVVVLNGPGYDVEAIENYNQWGERDDLPGRSMEHPLIFEADNSNPTWRTNMMTWFDESDPAPRDMTLIIPDVGGNASIQWNYTSFSPAGYNHTNHADGTGSFWF